jgi:hypothetical protein
MRCLENMQGVLCQKLSRVLTILQHNVGKNFVIPFYVKRHFIDIVLKFQSEIK